MAKVAKLKITAGFVRDKDIVLPMDEEFSIGRDRRRSLPVMSRKVSRNHCLIKCKDGQHTIVDLDSKQGTIVNGKRIETSRLRNGDIIQIGSLKAEYVWDEVVIAKSTSKNDNDDDLSKYLTKTPPPPSSASETPPPPPKTPDKAAPPAKPAPEPATIPDHILAEVQAQTVAITPDLDEDASDIIITPPKPKVRAHTIIPPRPKRKPAIDQTPSGIHITGPEFTKEERALVGKTIGHVRIISAMNRGRRTVIYKGIHDGKNRVVAFKVLDKISAHDPDTLNWFIEGAKVAGSFRHEDGVSLLGGGRDVDRVFAYSRFMDGGSAEDRFADALHESLPSIKRALETIVHVARALEFANSKGIFHGGVRPAKILYDEKRRAKLNCLGFRNGPEAPGSGSAVELMTTYLSPEQAGGACALSVATEMYSLGATFYYMLTGRRPKRDARQRLNSPKDVNELVPDSICRIIEKMVAAAPDRRYRSYGQLLHDVRWALRGEAWPRA
jgi:FHA domain/Protein kinase domain